jgi:TetR/AcrR family transcriptional regulator, cholesterol catabolism regulator
MSDNSKKDEIKESDAASKTRKEKRSTIKMSFILSKASALFWKKGYQATSMRDVAGACKCNPSNIYYYFKSKEDILYAVIEDITKQTISSIEHLENDETTNSVDQLKSFIKSHFELMASQKRSSVLISDTGLKDLTSEHRKAIIRLRDRYDAIMRKVIRRGIDAGLLSVKDEKVAAFLISSAIMRSSIWFSPKGRLSADEIGDMMFDLFLKGMTASTRNE